VASLRAAAPDVFAQAAAQGDRYFTREVPAGERRLEGEALTRATCLVIPRALRFSSRIPTRRRARSRTGS